MNTYVGDIADGSTVHCAFNSHQADGTPITLVGGAAAVHKDDDLTQSTSGVTLTTDFDGVTGCHLVEIDTSGAFYTTGSDYTVRLTAGTVDGVDVSGTVLFSFSIENRLTGEVPTAAEIAAAVVAALEAGVITVTGGSGTVITGAAAYCSASQFCDRYDWRSARDLLSDDGTPLANRAAVEASAVLATLLKQSSGVVESLALKGGRYTPDDLAAIVTAGGNGKEFLAGLVAGHALWSLFDRRPGLLKQLPESAKQALEWLDRLAAGEAIFGLTETVDAGLPETKRELAATVENRQMLTGHLSRGLGRRTNRIDPY